MGLDHAIYKNGDEAIVMRKENWVHGWVDRRIEGGVENTTNHELTIDDLFDLFRDMNLVLQDYDPHLIAELLPPTSGFFFGSTEVGDWYFLQVRRRRDELEKLLESHEEGDEYVYWSWW